jgi:phospholipid/cholesterol/gamma-HCH transport system ATP-binding protein
MTTQNGEPVIKLKSLHKSFGHQVVLKGLDLQVAKGKTVAVLGRSGKGKSVLLKLIIGLIQPDSGSIHIGGEEISKIPRERLNEIRKGIGFLFQQGALYDSLTVQENVAFPLRRHTKMSDKEILDQAADLLSRVEMQDSMKKMPAEISGGMQKRVGLARALALKPEIMLLDEPTTGLDPITAGEIINLISKLQQEHRATSMIVTHDMRTVKALSTSAAILDDGKLVMEGTFEDFEKSNFPLVSEFVKQSSLGDSHV